MQGRTPQAGQTWNVNIDVPVAGHIIHVQTIQLTAGRTPTQLGFDFTMTSDRAVAGATVTDVNPIIDCKSGCGGGGGGGGADVGVSGFGEATGPFFYGSAAEGYVPAGLKTFAISDVSVFFKGPWQVSWRPHRPRICPTWKKSPRRINWHILKQKGLPLSEVLFSVNRSLFWIVSTACFPNRKGKGDPHRRNWNISYLFISSRCWPPGTRST